MYENPVAIAVHELNSLVAKATQRVPDASCVDLCPVGRRKEARGFGSCFSYAVEVAVQMCAIENGEAECC